MGATDDSCGATSPVNAGGAVKVVMGSCMDPSPGIRMAPNVMNSTVVQVAPILEIFSLDKEVTSAERTAPKAKESGVGSKTENMLCWCNSSPKRDVSKATMHQFI
mmetsp:Transcript_162/g.291  ORF Transcript_162/g.291 Transcript_162/m.291 type:complete len:105 (-) Transcript_162:186-500(-)